MTRLRVCIATWELKPFTAGGIGTLVHNILKTCDFEKIELSVLWYGEKHFSPQMLGKLFPQCRFFSVHDWKTGDEFFDPPGDKFQSQRHLNSFELMKALKKIELELGKFDVIEFPDFAGAAYATLQEKLLGRAFLDTKIAVRIHSTESVLRRYDHRSPDFANPFVADMERKALLDADFVISHLEPIAADVTSHFGFPDEWKQKVRTEYPPILANGKTNERLMRFDADTPLVFSSKIQWVKRPHAFINAAVSFMRSCPDYKGDAYLLAHFIDAELLDHCKRLIPEALKPRFAFMHSASSELRDSIIGKGIVVFPNSYESFCLAAYEANQLGGYVVVNGLNPAFGSGTGWLDGQNCTKFTGSVSDLSRQLVAIWQRKQLSNQLISHPQFRAMCWQGSEIPKCQKSSSGGRLALSFVIMNIEGDGDLLETLTSALDIQDLDLEIIISRDFEPSESHISAIVERLAEGVEKRATIKICQSGYQGGLAALCNQGAQLASHDILAFARAGSVLSKEFIIEAVKALNRNREYDFVIPQSSSKDFSQSDMVVDKVRIGEALNSGVIDNLFGGIEMVARRSAVLSVGFDEDLDRFVDWDFHMRACSAGHRYIVGNYVEACVEPAIDAQSYRAHLDSVLVKHALPTDGGKVSLATAFDGGAASSETAFGGGAEPSAANGLLFANRPLAYYWHEWRDWRVIARRHPFKPLRWLMVREVQKLRARNASRT